MEKEFKETIGIKFWYTLFRFFLSPIVRFIWIRKIEGVKNIPKSGPCIIAANHSSFFDFICFIAVSPRKIYYLAAEKFFKWKIWRFLVKATGQIKVERESKDKNEIYGIILSLLKQGKMFGIFPEGTRSPDGEIHKAFTGAAKFSLMARVPVIPVGIKNTFEILPRQKRFPKFRKIVEVKIGEPMFFSEYYGGEKDEKALREITNKIMIKIAELSDKKYGYLEE